MRFLNFFLFFCFSILVSEYRQKETSNKVPEIFHFSLTSFQEFSVSSVKVLLSGDCFREYWKLQPDWPSCWTTPNGRSRRRTAKKVCLHFYFFTLTFSYNYTVRHRDKESKTLKIVEKLSHRIVQNQQFIRLCQKLWTYLWLTSDLNLWFFIFFNFGVSFLFFFL